MNFLKKLFSSAKTKKEPDNTILLSLLNNYSTEPSNQNYEAVMAELLHGSAFLLIPSVNDDSGTDEWTTVKKGKTLKLNGIFNLDGLKVLGAFTDEEALLRWAKKPTQYTALGTDTVFDICKDLAVGRVVIDSDSPTMFVLERSRENITTTTIQEETSVKVGTPAKPLNQNLLKKIIDNFKKVDTILEAYQYAQQMNNEISIVLGIRLSVVTENSRLAVQNALTNALENEKLDLPLDVMILETDEWLQTVKKIEKSLFYQK